MFEIKENYKTRFKNRKNEQTKKKSRDKITPNPNSRD